MPKFIEGLGRSYQKIILRLAQEMIGANPLRSRAQAGFSKNEDRKNFRRLYLLNGFLHSERFTMAILQETAQRVRQKLGSHFEKLTIDRVVVGLFFTGAKLSNGAGGVSYTPAKDIPQAVCCPSSAGRIFDPAKINGMKAADVLGALSSGEPIKAAIAIATLNALSAICWERGLTDNYRIQVNMDAVDVVRMPAKSSVAVVGAFF